MKMLKNLSWVVAMIVLSFFAGCSKKSDTTSPSSINYVAPTLAKDTLIKIPSTMADKANSGNDVNLSIGVSEIDLVNAFSTGLAGAFFYDQSTIDGWGSIKNSDGSTSYTWKYLQYTVKLTYFYSASESWWKYEEDSSSYSYPLYYIDDKGTSGETDWYAKSSFNAPTVATVYKDVWSKSNGTYNSTFNFYSSDGSTINTQFVSVSNSDRSGNLKVYTLNDSNQLVLQWYYVWDSAGGGSYTNYAADGVTVNFSGTF